MCKNFFVKYYCFDVILKKKFFYLNINYSVNQYFGFYFWQIFQILVYGYEKYFQAKLYLKYKKNKF